MDCSMPGLPVIHYLLKFTQTHVHQVGDAIQSSHPLSPLSPPALNLSQHQGLFQWVGSLHQVAKGLGLQLQHQSFQWIFRVDFLSDWLAWSLCSPSDSQESYLASQFKMIQLSHSYMTTGKTISLITWTFVGQVMSLLFNTLSKVCHSFSSKEQTSFNFMAAVTICSDLGAQRNKVRHCFHCFHIYFPWSDGTRCHDLRFLNVEL